MSTSSGIDEREDCRIRANADGNRKDNRRGYRRRFAHLQQSVPRILQRRFEPFENSCRSSFFFDPRQISQLQPLSRCFFRRDLHRAVKFQFLANLRSVCAAAKRPP